MATTASLVLSGLLLAGCGDGDSSPEPATPKSSNATASMTEAVPDLVACPNALGGTCLGALESGTYTTQTFTPSLTFTVPAGWSNLEDLPGNFLLLPPGRRVEGVDAGTDDYVGVYSGASVAAEDCSPQAAPDVGHGPRPVLNELAERRGLQVTEPRRVDVGGLQGLVADIELVPGTSAGCEVGPDRTIIPLIIGTGPAELEHAQAPGLRTRLYILARADSNIIIEVSDVASDRRPLEFEPVVESFRFG